MPENARPLILTLAMDETSFALFDDLRRRHFPPERNFIPAHITLFHALPGDEEPAIRRELEAVSRRQPPIILTAAGVRSLGRGTAYFFEAPGFRTLRDELAVRWRAWLTPQDQQRARPHVTVQNKVSPEEARALLQTLSAGFQPFTVQGEGLLLWRYLGGPWERVGHFPFQG